ncbi:MAG: NAD(P)H-binding protein [Saprospiraceae bacterium]|nr:NAD(P)H-binding protein [Saprospiraceae bacterium]
MIKLPHARQFFFLLYGANGYTGQVTARMAKDKGLSPVLAGRNEGAIKALAQTLNLDYLVFDLSDTAQLKAALAQVPVVLNDATHSNILLNQ